MGDESSSSSPPSPSLSSSPIKIHSDLPNHRQQEVYISNEVEIPSHFLCPISLQLMQDPVILSTGITYDRPTIDRWLSTGNTICPVTKQNLPTEQQHLHLLIPNHNLRRLIQSWCLLHSIDRIPTPKPPAEDLIHHLLSESKHSNHSRNECLRRLRSIKDGNDNGRYGWSHQRILKSPGAVSFLTGMVIAGDGEALSLLARINLTGQHLQQVLINSEAAVKLSSGEDRFIQSLISNFLLLPKNTTTTPNNNQSPDCNTSPTSSAISALKLLKVLYSVGDSSTLAVTNQELFIGIVQLLQSHHHHHQYNSLSPKDLKLILKLLIILNPWGRNRIKAVEAGTVETLIELLLNTNSIGVIGSSSSSPLLTTNNKKRLCDLVMIALDQLTGCAEGRAALVNHAAGLAVISKKILRVSNVVTDRAVRVLSCVAKNTGSLKVLTEMLEVGVVSKLCLVLGVDFVCKKTKDRVKEILKMHSRVWRDSKCIPSNLVLSYPN